MALSLVQHKFAQDSTGSATTVSDTVTATTANTLLVAFVLSANAGTANPPTGVSDGTNTFTQFPSARVTYTSPFVGVVSDCYYLAHATAGKTSITLTVSGPTTFLEIEVWEVSGFTTPIPDGTANLGTGGGTCVGTTATGAPLVTTAVGFLAATCGPNAGAITANPKVGNAFTTGGDNTADAFCSLISSGASTYTPAWTDSSSGDTFTSFVVAFKDTVVAFVPRQTYMVNVLTQ